MHLLTSWLQHCEGHEAWSGCVPAHHHVVPSLPILFFESITIMLCISVQRKTPQKALMLTIGHLVLLGFSAATFIRHFAKTSASHGTFSLGGKQKQKQVLIPKISRQLAVRPGFMFSITTIRTRMPIF